MHIITQDTNNFSPKFAELTQQRAHMYNETSIDKTVRILKRQVTATRAAELLSEYISINIKIKSVSWHCLFSRGDIEYVIREESPVVKNWHIVVIECVYYLFTLGYTIEELEEDDVYGLPYLSRLMSLIEMSARVPYYIKGKWVWGRTATLIHIDLHHCLAEHTDLSQP